MKKLPIHDVLDELTQNLQNSNKLILQAPPGAGKSTVVPISLLEESWLDNKMIIMLEPRRVAARMVAQQMASLLGEELGERVGYQVRQDSCYSKKTKLLVVTEAILVRKLQNDQSLESVAMVIFDEFHERSIHTDLSLALCLQVQELLREDLKLLIMSATLNAKSLLELLGHTPVITSEGKVFDIEMRYLPKNIKHPDVKSINQLLYDTTLMALKEQEGDILVFLAGAKEIKHLKKLLDASLKDDVDVLPLYSALSKKEQDRALQKSVKRKVILATNIAQTSLTIEGVSIVIDSGLQKLSLYDDSNAMDHLQLEFISKDDATQRAGRAGRLSKGVCYRLWHENRILNPSIKPEILRSDISSFLLELSAWGYENLEEFKLLDTPSVKAQQSTTVILEELGMLNEEQKITELGRKALALGVHPRFAYAILKANEIGFAYEGCLLCALLESKELLKNNSSADLYARFLLLYDNQLNRLDVHRNRAKEAIKQASYFYEKLKKLEVINTKKGSQTNITEDQVAQILLYAYPDRLAKRRALKDNRYKLSNGKGAILNVEDELFNEEYIIAPLLHAKAKDSYIKQAIKISASFLEREFSDHIKTEEQITYNKQSNRIETKEVRLFFELELESKASSQKAHNYTKLFLEWIKKEGLQLLTWSQKSLELQQRINFINAHQQNAFPSFEENALLRSVDKWLEPYLNGVTTIKALEELDLYSILLSRIDWDMQQALEQLAPTHIKVPSGSKIKIDYANSKKPILAVRLQEMFGLHETPKVLNGQIALQLHLLSPAHRAIQITYDLKSFWQNSYLEVRKELAGKYKKHYWPEDPFEAIATNKTKKQMK